MGIKKRIPILILLLCATFRLARATKLTVDAASPGATVSSMLFGDQIQWPGFGQDLLKVDSSAPSSGQLRTDVLDQLRPQHLQLLRYPGGTLSSFFHWEVSTGPYSARGPSQTMDLLEGSTWQYQTQIVYFGTDEFIDTARYLGTEMMITPNINSDTPAGAAAWLRYFKAQGLRPKYWEIGNEEYLSGVPLLDATHLTAAQYAGKFDAFAAALRAVDPSVAVGIIGVHLAAPALDTWNRDVLSAISQPVDFMAVHNAYAPEDHTFNDTPAAYQSLLAAPQRVQDNLQVIKGDISSYAAAASQGLSLAITEHAALWQNPTTDIATGYLATQRNWSLGSALYSALLFHVFLREPKVQIANHINPLSPVFQAPLTVALPNIPGLPGYDAGKPFYPKDYDPAPVPSACFQVFQLYSDSAGGRVLSVNQEEAPTFDSQAFGNVPAYQGLKSLDAVAVAAPGSSGRIFLYVVNRDVTRDLAADIEIQGLPSALRRLEAAQVSAADVSAHNGPGQPNNVRLSVQALEPNSSFRFTFPAHSLTRFTAEFSAPSSDLSQVEVYPNPFRPAQGHRWVRFIGVPSGATVTLFTSSGEKVIRLTSDPSGQAQWDGRTSAGRSAASGVYVALIEAGGVRRRLKLAVQQ